MIDVSAGFQGFRYVYASVETQQDQRHAVDFPSAQTLQGVSFPYTCCKTQRNALGGRDLP
jgi:hypothetical protein